MKYLKLFVLCSIGWLAFGQSQAQAGWNNVFQTCCNNCDGPRTSRYFAPAPQCCQKIEYVQRACYTPVTVWKREVYQEPVTVRYRSFYWEPVTSTTYTSYYDPCTGCSRQVPEQRTSYRLRSEMNCSQRYVQRCRMVPVTEQRVSYYMEPVVVNPEPSNCCNNDRPIQRPGITETPGASLGDPQSAPSKMPTGDERIKEQNIQQSRSPRNPLAPPAPANTRLDRVASNGTTIQGRLMREDRFTPQGYSKVVLVSSSNESERRIVETDASGRFAAKIPSGEWSIYTPANGGKLEYHSTLTARDNDVRSVMIVSR